ASWIACTATMAEVAGIPIAAVLVRAVSLRTVALWAGSIFAHCGFSTCPALVNHERRQLPDGLWRSVRPVLPKLRLSLERDFESASSCSTVVATLLAHGTRGLTGDKRQQQETTAFEHLAIVGGLLFVVIHGAGRLSLDNLLQ